MDGLRLVGEGQRLVRRPIGSKVLKELHELQEEDAVTRLSMLNMVVPVESKQTNPPKPKKNNMVVETASVFFVQLKWSYFQKVVNDESKEQREEERLKLRESPHNLRGLTPEGIKLTTCSCSCVKVVIFQ